MTRFGACVSGSVPVSGPGWDPELENKLYHLVSNVGSDGNGYPLVVQTAWERYDDAFPCPNPVPIEKASDMAAALYRRCSEAHVDSESGEEAQELFV